MLNKVKTNKMLSVRCRLSLICNESVPEWIDLWKSNAKSVKARLHSKWGLLPRKPINNSKNYCNIFLSCLKQIQQKRDKIYENSDIIEVEASLYYYTFIDHNTLSIWYKQGLQISSLTKNINLACCLPVPIWSKPQGEVSCNLFYPQSLREWKRR